MTTPARPRPSLPLSEVARTTVWSLTSVLSLGVLVLVAFEEPFRHARVLEHELPRSAILFWASLAGVVTGLAALRAQLRRNAVAYLGGQPRPLFRRTPRPMRSASDGEVHTGSGYRRAASRTLTQIRGHMSFSRRG